MISNISLSALAIVGLFCVVVAGQDEGFYVRKQCNADFFENVIHTWLAMDQSNVEEVQEFRSLTDKNIAVCQVALYSPSNPMSRKHFRDAIREKILAAKSCSNEKFEPSFQIPSEKLINGALDYLESTGKIKVSDYKGDSVGASFDDKFAWFTSVLEPNVVEEFPRNAADLAAFELAREMAIVIEMLNLKPSQSLVEDIIDQKIGNALRQYTETDGGLGGVFTLDELRSKRDGAGDEAEDTFAQAAYHKLQQRANGVVDC